MSNRQKARILMLPILLTMLFVSLRYAIQPVDIYGLVPGMEVDLINISLIDLDNMEITDRHLRLTPEDPQFDEVLSRLEELRFRRPLTNFLFQAMPFLADIPSSPKTVEDGEIDHLYISLAQAGQKTYATELGFELGEWEYRDFEHNVSLPLDMNDGKEIGQALANDLWKMAPEG